jgi:guanylate kinase
MVDMGQFITWKQSVYGYYGMSYEALNCAVASGGIALLDMDVDSYLKLRSIKPDTVGIFLLPESIDVIRNRLLSRGPERGIHTKHDAWLRIRNAVEITRYASCYDYVLENVNDEHIANRILEIYRFEQIKSEKVLLIQNWYEQLNQYDILENKKDGLE